jgi:hypothetical protein
MLRRIINLASLGALACGGGGEREPGWIRGQATFDEEPTLLDATLHTVARAGQLHAATRDPSRGFDLHLHGYAVPAFGAGAWDLSKNTSTRAPPVRVIVVFPLENASVFSEAFAGTLHTDHVPTPAEPYWSGSVKDVRADLTNTPCNRVPCTVPDARPPAGHRVHVADAQFAVRYSGVGVSAFYGR